MPLTRNEKWEMDEVVMQKEISMDFQASLSSKHLETLRSSCVMLDKADNSLAKAMASCCEMT
jgi:hypothetical protein